jgi:hypothetical protein
MTVRDGGRHRMVVGFLNTYAISAYDHYSSNLVHGEVHLIQHYAIQFFSDLRQICGFLRFPPQTIVESGV